jgi:WD40 repeat protein
MFRYGYVSLPRTIPRSILDARLYTCSREVHALAHRWYHLDRNAVPEEYVLKPLTHIADQTFWAEALPCLTAAFNGLRFLKATGECNEETDLLVGRSVTEWETKAALSQPNSVLRAFWMKRTFTNGVDPALDSAKHYDDTVGDKERHEKLEHLKSLTRNRLPASRCVEHTVDFQSYIEKSGAWNEHVTRWTNDVFEILSNSLADLTSLRQNWDLNGCELGLPGYALNEMLHHCYWAVDKCSSFHGREALIHAALITLADKSIVSVMNKLELLRRIRKRSFHRPQSVKSQSAGNPLPNNNDSFDNLFLSPKSKLTRIHDKSFGMSGRLDLKTEESPCGAAECLDGIRVVNTKPASPHQKQTDISEDSFDVDCRSPASMSSNVGEGAPRRLSRSKSSFLEKRLREVGEIVVRHSEGTDAGTIITGDDSARGLPRKDSLDAFSLCSEDISLNSDDDYNENFEVEDDYLSDDDEETLYACNPWVRLRLGIMLNIEDIVKIFQEMKDSFDKSVFKVNNQSFHRSSFFGKILPRSPRSPKDGQSLSPKVNNGTTGNQKSPRMKAKFSFSDRALSNSPRTRSSRAPFARTLSKKGNNEPDTKSKAGEGLRRMARSSIKFSELHSTASFQRKPSQHNQITRDGYRGISLCVVGVSGAGKTALMAMLAAEVAKNQLHKNRLVIARFCGTSPGSTNGHSLVQSICHQIELGVGKSFNKKLETMSYMDVVTHFHGLMAAYPVVLLIDSLDQLSDADLARSDISFLKGITPHPKSKIIVSTLPDERNSDSGEWIYYYGCDSKLAAAGVKRIEVTPFQQATAALPAPSLFPGGGGPLSASGSNTSTDSQSTVVVNPFGHPRQPRHTPITSSTHSLGAMSSNKLTGEGEGISVMKSMLERRGRTLTPMQWSYVIDQISVEPTALYLWLAVRVVEKWSSNNVVDLDVQLAPGVKPLINQIFDEVERSYGKSLTRAAVGLITFSTSGVSDAEMEDLLSLDPEVMESVNQYCQDTNRLPSHVWLRLRGVIYGLVTEREGGCLGWYHRQLKETAEARYSAADRHKLHTLLATYYGGLIDEETLVKTCVSRQPLIHNNSNSMSVWLPEARINNRRCEEAAAHMIRAKMYHQAITELCTVEAVVARAKTGKGFALITQLSLLLKFTGDSIVDHYYRWIRRDIHSILLNPALCTTLTCGRQPLSSLARRDLNSCLKNYAVTKFISADAVGTVKRSTSRDNSKDLEGRRRPSLTINTSSSQNENPSGNVWIRCRSLGGEHDFDLLQSILQSHTETISCVCYNSDGSKIASASWDRSVKIWDASIGNILCTLEGHADSVMSVAFNAEASLIVTASEDQTVRLWDAVVGSITRILEGHTSCVNSACFSPDSMTIASGSNDGTVKIWDTLDGMCQMTLEGHTNNVSCVKISYDGQYIVSAGHDNSIRLWHLIDGRTKFVLNGHTDRVNSVCFSFDSKLIVSGSDDETVRTWDVATGRSINVFEGQHDPVPSVCISSDNALIVSGSWDSTIRVWDPTTGQLFCSLDGHTGTVNSVCMFENGDTVASGSEDKTVRIWDINVWYSDRSSIVGHSGYVTCVSFSNDGKLIVSGSEDKSIKIWDVLSGDVIRTLEGHTGDITSVAISLDNSKIVSGSSDHVLNVWNIATGAVILTVHHRYDQPYVSFHPNGELVAAASWGYAVRIWNLSGKVVGALKGHTGDVASISFSSDGSRLLSGSSDCTVAVWDVSKAICVHTFAGHEQKVTSVSWCTDESKVASGSEDMTVRVWDSSNLSCGGSGLDDISRLLYVLVGHTDIVTSVSFCFDGSAIVSGSWDFTVRVWDANSGSRVHCLEGHTNRVNSVNYCADGTKIVSSSDDKSILVWDASNGTRLPGRRTSRG